MFKKLIVICIAFLLIVSVVACTSEKPAVQTPTQKPVQTNPAPAPNSSSTPASNPAPQQTVSKPKQPSGLIKAKWIEPKVNGTTVSIPVSEIESNWNTHFKIQVNGSTENFMAYNLDGTIYVRANVCPPCKSIGFSLDKDILVCDRCATTFKANTGAGIKGACVNYPKAAVKYQTVGGNVVLDQADLVKAYQDTLQPG